MRAKGAIGVVQCEKLGDLAGLREKFAEKGVWIRPFGDIVSGDDETGKAQICQR